MSVAGKWKVTIKSPTGPQNTILELKEEGGKITGAQSGQGSTTEIADATWDGSKLFWVNNITKPMKMKVEFTATCPRARTLPKGMGTCCRIRSISSGGWLLNSRRN